MNEAPTVKLLPFFNPSCDRLRMVLQSLFSHCTIKQVPVRSDRSCLVKIVQSLKLRRICKNFVQKCLTCLACFPYLKFHWGHLLTFLFPFSNQQNLHWKPKLFQKYIYSTFILPCINLILNLLNKLKDTFVFKNSIW